MRRAAKRDDSEGDIVAVLVGLGCSVYAVSAKDFPDLVVAMPWGETLLAECKTGTAKLETGQQRFAALWKGRIVILRTAADALSLVANGRHQHDAAVTAYHQRRLDSHRDPKASA